MASTDLTRAFSALLESVAELEPRHGFQTVQDINLTADQVATVTDYDTDVMEALAIALPAITAQLRAPAIDSAAIGRIVTDALSAAARKTVLREVVAYCDDARLPGEAFAA